MAELPDLTYNQSVPVNWWTTDAWTPTRWCYGMDTYGGGWGADTDDAACCANNVYLITLYLKAVGWSFESIMALCGNYQNESGLDPRDWQSPGNTTRGFGLPQWTPQTKYQGWAEAIWDPLTDPFAPFFYNGWYEMYIQASECVEHPNRSWVKHTDDPHGNPSPGSPTYPDYPGYAPDYNYWLSYPDFARGLIPVTLPDNPYDRINYLTGAFYWNYERVADFTADYTIYQRRNRARQWYDRMIYRFNNFPGRKPMSPNVPDPDFTVNDIVTKYPAWMYKVFYMSSHKQGGLKDYAR